MPGYLKKDWGEDRWQRIAKFKLSNEMKGGRYWKLEEKKMCRMYGREEETWKHVWNK